MSGGSKSYTIKALFINQLFSVTLLLVFILYFDKIRHFYSFWMHFGTTERT